MARCRKRLDLPQNARPQQRIRMREEFCNSNIKPNVRDREERGSVRGDIMENLAFNTILENVYNEEVIAKIARRNRLWADTVDEEEATQANNGEENLAASQERIDIEDTKQEESHGDTPRTPEGSQHSMVRESPLQVGNENTQGANSMSRNNIVSSQNSSNFTPIVDEDGFEMALTKLHKKT